MNANYKSIILAISLFFALSASTSAAPGDLDPTFGSGGIVITREVINNPNLLNTAWGMAIQPDGKIVVVGDGTLGFNWDFAVVRYNPDGSLDSSFGGTGIVITQLDPINYEGATSVAIQADGKIVVAGSRYVVRYNPNGSLDTSFNGTGIVITPGGGVTAVAVQSDGKIIAAGSSHDGSTFGFALTRYNADGSLDTSFNGTGKAITPGGAVTSVAIQSEGRIIAAGYSHFGSNADFMLVRHNADGTPDTSFNGTGKVVTSVGTSRSGASDLAIQSDGKIVAAGYGLAAPDDWRTADVAVVRYNPDGSLDTSFGGTGKLLIPASDSTDHASSVAIQPNGKIVVAGGTSSSPFIGSDFAVVRLNPNGSLDTSFNGTGKAITSVGNAYDHASSVVIQADGKIVVAGDTGSDVNAEFVVVRYQGDGATSTPTACPNPINCNEFFVRQQYLDFLNREPDAAGFNDWLNVLNGCEPNQGGLGSHPSCDRVHVSSGFFRSTEFGERGYWIYRFYESALGRRPQFAEFLPESQGLSGLMTTAELEAKRTDFINRFMQLPEFKANFDGLTDAGHAAQFVAKLEQVARVNLLSSATTELGQPPQYGRQQLIDLMASGQFTAGQTLLAFIEQKVVWDTYFYRAFVAMQYFGYLRRDPEDAGYNDWVRVLTFGDAPTGIQPGDYRHLIFGFVYSVEYRERFGRP